MKKFLAFLSVIMLSFALFASKSEATVKLSPMAIQIAVSSDKEDGYIPSKYGIGAEVSYKRFFVKGFFAQAGLSWNTFIMPQDRPSFTALMGFAGAGYRFDLSDTSTLTVNANIATDTLLYDSTCSETITVKTGLDYGFAVSRKINLTVGCDGTFGFSKKDGKNYVNYRILPAIGMSIGL